MPKTPVHRGRYLPAELLREGAVERTVKEFGWLDVLVNSAAFQVHTSRFEDLTAKHFDQTLKNQPLWLFLCGAASGQENETWLGDRKHRLSRRAAWEPALLDYSMTKGSIHAVTRSLATHHVPRGIRVNGSLHDISTNCPRAKAICNTASLCVAPSDL